MNSLVDIVFAFLTSLAAGLFLLPQLSHFASKLGLLDYNNRRKVHIVPRPYIGGLAMIISLFFSSILFIPITFLKGFYAGILILTLMGILDDLRELDYGLKFFAQILASVYMIYFNNAVILSFGDLLSFGPIYPGIFAIAATIFCTVGIINSINMIDGLDGLAGAVSLISFISLAILATINNQMELMFLSVALAGTVIAFLKYNWPPSSLFMGDTGSHFIGFSIAFLSIAITQKNDSLVPPVVPLLILGIPLVDTLTVMIKRMIKGKNPFRADKTHLHHILLRFGLAPQTAVKVIFSLSLILSSLGILGTVFKIPDYYLFSMFVIYFILYFISSFYIKQIFRLKRKLEKNRKRKYGVLREQSLSFMQSYDNKAEKRKYLRHHVILPFYYSVSNNGEGREYWNVLLDIGVGGFSAKMNELLLENDFKVSLILQENGNQKKVTAMAKLVWKYQEEDYYKYGFKFTNIEEKQKEILKDYLHGLAKELRYSHRGT